MCAKHVLLSVKPVKTLQIFAYRPMAVIEGFIFIMIPIAVSPAVQTGITQIYLLAAILSATGEKNPNLAWHLNMQSLLKTAQLL